MLVAAERRPMLPLDDDRWATLRGGYRVPCDASLALRQLEGSAEPDVVWKELWNELHHQGDVDEASYAAVPHLVRIARERAFTDWNLYALASTVEIARLSGENPPLPVFLEESYEHAWADLVLLGLEHLETASDALVIQSILGAVAIGKGLLKLGRLLAEYDASEIEELYESCYGQAGG